MGAEVRFCSCESGCFSAGWASADPEIPPPCDLNGDYSVTCAFVGTPPCEWDEETFGEATVPSPPTCDDDWDPATYCGDQCATYEAGLQDADPEGDELVSVDAYNFHGCTIRIPKPKPDRQTDSHVIFKYEVGVYCTGTAQAIEGKFYLYKNTQSHASEPYERLVVECSPKADEGCYMEDYANCYATQRHWWKTKIKLTVTEVDGSTHGPKWFAGSGFGLLCDQT